MSCFFLFFLFAGATFAAMQNVTFMPSRYVALEHKQHFQDLKSNLSFDPNIAVLIELIQDDWLRAHVMELSGEAADSTQITRVSDSINNINGINRAVNYVEQKLGLEYGATVQVDFWDESKGPNVLGIYPGSGPNADTHVILGAHLDNIPSTGRAPGANDDGSGSGALLAIAQAISEYDAKFDFTLVLEFYTGEEQGLLGSRALARRRAERKDKVLAMIQQDMTAVQLSGDPVGVAFVQGTAVDPTLSALVFDIFGQYKDHVGELTVFEKVLSGSQCCSDHQSYVENGYPSVGLIEPRGYTGDPMYHTVGDVLLRDEYNVAQATSTARAALAAAATLAKLLA